MTKQIVGTDLEPVLMEGTPVAKPYGGGRLGTADDGEPIGEIWLVSTRPEAQSHVASGTHAGEPLTDYLRETGAAGIPVEDGDDFPVLIKKLNSGERCPSIQVHPDDAYARAHGEPYGKTEMWVFDEPGPGNYVYFGVRRALTPEELAADIADGSICDDLARYVPRRGSVYFTPAGTIHTYGPQELVWEIQQNSNTTYRVFDFDNRDANGNPRELHIAAAKEVAVLEPTDAPGPLEEPRDVDGGTRQLLAECPSFSTWRFVADATNPLYVPVMPRSFEAVIVTDGTPTISLGDWSATLAKDDVVFVPAQDARLMVRGAGELLVTTLGR